MRRAADGGRNACRDAANANMASLDIAPYPNVCRGHPGELMNELTPTLAQRKTLLIKGRAGDPSAGRVFTSTGPGAVPRGSRPLSLRLLAVALAVAAGQGEQLHEQQCLYGEI